MCAFVEHSKHKKIYREYLSDVASVMTQLDFNVCLYLLIYYFKLLYTLYVTTRGFSCDFLFLFDFT